MHEPPCTTRTISANYGIMHPANSCTTSCEKYSRTSMSISRMGSTSLCGGRGDSDSGIYFNCERSEECNKQGVVIQLTGPGNAPLHLASFFFSCLISSKL